MSDYASRLKAKNCRIGLVPTMGYLHAGHLSLFKLLEGKCDVAGASIFVNPIQFGKGEDLDCYPRDENRDLELLTEVGCSFIFIPSAKEMYPTDFQTFVNVEKLTDGLCGRFRPGHFRGVTTVVLRLFSITRCDIAAFGLKDFQQAIVIKKMRDDLNLLVELVFGETLRENDGLAMSSRNSFLSDEQRALAAAIPRALEWARREASKGDATVSHLRNGMMEILREKPGLSVQYLEFVDPETLDPESETNHPVQVLLAVYAGNTRLIDNIMIGKGSKSKPINGVIV